jgi:hypothetical protein
MERVEEQEYVSECNDTYVAFGGGEPPGRSVEDIMGAVGAW